MKLPWRTRVETAPVGEDTPVPEKAPTRIFASPGLEEAVRGVPSDGSCRVLDLGSSVAQNVEFVSAFSSYVYIFDAVDRQAATAAEGEPDFSRLGLLGSLADRHRRSFNLVLTWDLINYLSREQAERLVQAVAELCLPNARLHAIVASSETMPAVPNRYRIADRAHLEYEPCSTDVRGAPGLPPSTVEKLLKGFRIEHSFVLQHSVHEYVASRKRWYVKT